MGKIVFKKILSVFTVTLILILFPTFYFAGLTQGYNLGQKNAETDFLAFLQEKTSKPKAVPTETPEATPTSVPRVTTVVPKVSWGGPDLWNAVNKRRVELGVNPLQARSELCTIASIRLNELLEKGKLDGHEGFSNMAERRPDLKWIFEKYNSISEFLAMGGKSAQETVSLWENTLGHNKILSGGEYVWGCIYAQNTFAVAIAAF